MTDQPNPVTGTGRGPTDHSGAPAWIVHVASVDDRYGGNRPLKVLRRKSAGARTRLVQAL